MEGGQRRSIDRRGRRGTGYVHIPLAVNAHARRANLAGSRQAGRKHHVPRRIELDKKGIGAARAEEGGIGHGEIGRIGGSRDVGVPARVLGNRGRLLHAAVTPRGPIANFGTRRGGRTRQQNNDGYAGPGPHGV